VRRWELPASLPDRLRIGDEAEDEVVGERLVVELAPEARPEQQRLQLRGEDERAADDGVVEGLLARPVARAEETLRAFVPDGEREHPREPLETAFAPRAEGLEEHFGV
jgi:hypothetical protein